MPRTLKRRSDAISRDDSLAVSSPEPEPSQRPARPRSYSNSSASSGSSTDNAGTSEATQETSIQNLSKKLVRLALSSEYARLPLRRSDITQKIFKESNASHRLFKPVFAATQKQLRTIFGMELLELPLKEKTSLKDRRTQATQTQTQNTKGGNASGGTSNKSWIVISILSKPYKTNPIISQPSKAPTQEPEAQYTGLYTFICALIYLNNSSLPEAKLERYLSRVNADTYTPLGSLDKILQRMVKEGYLEKKRDVTGGEEVIEYVIGPRGKVEVGINGVAGLVRSVYGFGAVSLGMDASGAAGEEEDEEGDENAEPRRLIKMEKDELEKRIKRSLGDRVGADGDKNGQRNGTGEVESNTQTGEAIEEPSERRGPGRSRRRRREDDDDDD